MSARDELRREMTHNHLYMTDEDADELIDAYAHQLAETIRASRDETRGAVQATKVMDFAAGLIDPYERPANSEEKAR